MRHERAERRISLVYVGTWSFHLNLVGSLGRLAAAVDQAAPAHDLRRGVQDGVNLLVAQVKKASKLLEWEQACTHGHK